MTTLLSAERKAEIEERLGKAEEGDWYRECSYVMVPDGMGGHSIAYAGKWDNARFIAHSPQDMADLLAEVKRLEEGLRGIVDICESMEKKFRDKGQIGPPQISSIKHSTYAALRGEEKL